MSSVTTISDLSTINKHLEFILSEFEELRGIKDQKEEIELIDYCKDISKLADQKIGVSFRNQGNLHAAVVMSTLFLHSKENIRIFAGDFNGRVSGVSIWKKSLLRSFNSNVNLKIEVVLENKPPVDSTAFHLLNELRLNHPDRVSVALLDKSKARIEFPDFHFAVGDDNKFRLETNTSNFKAVCNFDDKSVSNNLIDLFKILKSTSKELEA